MKYFKAWEYQCRCGCGADKLHPDLAIALDEIREELGCAVQITSGVRCKKHNKAVGGASGSQHQPDANGFGRAADIWAAKKTPREIEAVARKNPRIKGIGRDDERSFLHIDVRTGKATKWCYRNGKQVPWRP